MKTPGFMEIFERFFLDIIGTVLPGLFFIISVAYINNLPYTKLFDNTEINWLIVLGASYVVGHAICSLGINILIGKLYTPIFMWKKGLRKPFKFKTQEELSTEFITDPIYQVFQELLIQKIPNLGGKTEGGTHKNIWRNLALSVSQEYDHLVYRFTFLSLLNLGAATVIITTGFIWGLLGLINAFLYEIPVARFHHLFILAILLIPFFIDRYYYFNRISYQLPFNIATVKLGLNNNNDKQIIISKNYCESEIKTNVKVYLAGGFKSGWQDKVKDLIPNATYFDPSKHGLAASDQYTAWDLQAISKCDIVFAYLEATNPGGYALSLEIGYAKALGKFIIFVNENSADTESPGKYLKMVEASSNINCGSFDEGIQFLKKYLELE